MAFPWLLLGGIASTGLSAYGTYTSYKASKEAGKSGQGIKEQEAQFQLDRAALDEARLRFEAPRQLGAVTATLNKSGRSISAGTGLDLIAEAAREIELDALITRVGGDIRAQSALAEGDLLRESADNQATATLLSGGSRLLPYASSLAGSALSKAGSLFQSSPKYKPYNYNPTPYTHHRSDGLR